MVGASLPLFGSRSQDVGAGEKWKGHVVLPLYVTCEDTGAQRGHADCSRPHSWSVDKGSGTRLPSFPSSSSLSAVPFVCF